MTAKRTSPVLAWTFAVSLAAASFAVCADEPTFDFSMSVGLNYETAELAPSVTGDWPEGSVMKFRWQDVNGESDVVEEPSLHVTYECFIDRTAGRTLPIDGYIMSEDGTVTNAALHKLLVMGEVHDDDWMDEDAASFKGERTGTGTWSGQEMGTVSNGMIVVDTVESATGTEPVACDFGSVPAVPRACRGYTVTTTLRFDEPSTELMDPAGRPIGFTIAAPGELETSADAKFYFLDGGEWRGIPQSVCDPTVTNLWELHIAVDASNALARATYYVRPGGAGPWTILGTGTAQGAGKATTAGVWGKGALSGYKGNGFDTQLIQLTVEFDDVTLFPGCNFEETIVTGRVSSSSIHDTDRTNGTFTVSLQGSDGTVVASEDFTFVVGGDDMEFYVKAEALTPGCVYTATVEFRTEGVANDCPAWKRGVMGRPVTNDTWGTDWVWVHETARTYAGLDPGTGEWTGRDLTTTNEGWIVIDTNTEDTGTSSGQAVTFTPTNLLGETQCYVTKVRAIFNEAVQDPDDEEAVFGMTIGTFQDGSLAFLCLSNQVWKTVPTSIVEPELGREYGFTVYVEQEQSRLTYALEDEDGSELTLMSVDLDPDLGLCRTFDSVDIYGTGALTNLTACGYSTELVRLVVDFDADTLYPGTNFEATAANGVVHFTQLWDTDHTHGTLKVTIRDKWGDVIGIRKISFHDLSDRGFDYYITGLTPGESYSVSVTADILDLEDVGGSDSREGVMARIVSNDVWRVQGEWIRENVDTFATNAVGTGEWTYAPGIARAEGEYIVVETSLGADETINVTYTATNSLTEHTGYEVRSQMVFDRACQLTPTVTGRFGITLVTLNPTAGSDGDLQFMVISNGVWMTIDTDVYEPELGVEYSVRVKVDDKTGYVDYIIRADDDKYETLLATIAMDDAGADAPDTAEYYGSGRIRTLEGDGHDVSVIKISVDFDDTLQTPGTNFASFVAGGVLHIRQIWPTDKSEGTYTVTVKDARGKVVATKTVEYRELVDHGFKIPIDGLEAGGVYDVEVSATLGDDDVGSDTGFALTARHVGTWIDEDADTFEGGRAGTGIWSGTNGTASVYDTGAGRVIRISSSSDETSVDYAPTNDALSVRCSTLREVRMNLSFNAVGWFSDEAAPSVPTNVRAAVTVWSDAATEEVALAAIVATNDVYSWKVLENTRTSRSLTSGCDVHFLIDYKTGFVRYSLVTDSGTNRVCQFDFTPEFREETKISFTGDGYVRSVDGDTWDPNLITSATNEFADLNEAIRGSDSSETLSPLWYAEQWVDVGRGSFRIYDPDNWLVIHFPRWYYVIITDDGDVKVYEFNESNNWIDYALDGDENVETNGTLFLVKTPEGLSWIAARATNEWISGRIELARDIDLSAHNWTPIAGFSGTFDGKGHTITNLNNNYHNPELPNGEYIYGPTNRWGRSAYGLFGTATNATLTGVTFADVSISNLADSVAALAGALAGNCAVSNVTVASGTVRGLGGTVAGVAGFADFSDFLVAINNTNRAAVVAENLAEGDPRYAAGLLCVAGPTDPSAPLGDVTVTNNVNAGTVSGPIYNSGLAGGNIAQILAGTTWGARFGTVRLTGNATNGVLNAKVVRTSVDVLPMTIFPGVNLASILWGTDEDDTFYLAFDSNDPSAIPVDPVHRTARLLTSILKSGAPNESGALNDRITASAPGDTVTMEDSVESWGPIVLDRNITFDLGGNTLNAIWIQNPFVISNGVVTTVRNGTVIVGPVDEGGEAVEPFAGDTTGLTTEDLDVFETDADFYSRTTVKLSSDDDDFISPLDPGGSAAFASFVNSSGVYLELYRSEDTGVTIDVDAGTISVDGHVVAQLRDCYSFKVVKTEDGEAIGFEVKIVDSAAPQASDFTITGGDSGTVSVTVENAKEGFWYVIQHRSSLAEDWVTPPADDSDDCKWKQASGTGSVSLSATKDGDTGFYRILATDHDPRDASDE